MNKNYNCTYARFHHPVPPSENMEPVSEFRLSTKQLKYKVDSIIYTVDGLIVRAYSSSFIIPLANIIYCRIDNSEAKIKV